MKLIVGLGNPGKKYENTRHNVGFMVLDKIAQEKNAVVFRLENQFGAQITQFGGLGQDRIILVKPQTFMNLSGKSIRKIIDYYKIEIDDVWVVCDDLNIELGDIRVRVGGQSGGHNGLKSIIEAIGEDFWRIRVGIGSNIDTNKPAEAYVLEKFSKSELEIIKKSIDRCVRIVISSLSSGHLKEETIKI